MQRYAPRIVLSFILTVSIVLGSLQWFKWHTFGYNGLDLAIYTNTVHHLAHGQGFASSIHDPSYLGDHLELGLIPVAALYRLFPSGLTLLWTQTFVITGTAWIVWLFFRARLGWKGGLVAAIIWLLHPFVWNVALYEFHGIIFAWPLLWWSIYAYVNQQQRQWWVALTLLCFVREDLPLVVLGWSGLAALDRRGWRWWAPALAGGLLWFFVAQQLISSSNPDGAYKYLVFYRWAGETPLEILTSPFRHPFIFLSHVFQINNWQMTIGLLFASGGLALGRPRLLIPTALAFSQLLLLGAQPESVLRLHYVVIYLPFLLWAGVETWIDVRERRRWKMIDPMIATALATIVLILSPLYAHLLYGPLELPWKARADGGASPTAILRAAAAEVRPTDRVLTTFNFLANLASRPSVYSLNYLYLGKRQYSEDPYVVPTDIDVAVIDWQQLYQYQYFYRTTLFQDRTGAQRIRDLLSEQGLSLVWWKDNVAVYRRGGADAYQPTIRLNVTNTDGQKFGPLTMLAPPDVNPVVRQVINKKNYSTLPVQIQWFRTETNDLPLSIRFTAKKDSKDVWTSTRLIGEGVYPTVEWPVGSAWATRYFLSLPENISGEISLSAEVIEFSGIYQLNHLRTFTPVVKTARTFGTIDLGLITLPTRSQ